MPRSGPLAQKVFYEQGKGLLQGGRPEQAAAAFRKAIEAHDRGDLLASCYLGLGSALAELKKPKEAVRAYQKVVELLPGEPDAHRALAIGQEEAGEIGAAIKSMEQALALDPDQLSAYQDLAGLHLRKKDLERAKEVYQRYEFRRTALIKTLGLAKDPEQRELAAVALGDARDEATVKALGLALTDRNPRVRAAVIRALGQQGLAAGVGPLKAALRRSTDPAEERLIQLSLKAIAEAPQPKAPPAPQPSEDDPPAAGADQAAPKPAKAPAPRPKAAPAPAPKPTEGPGSGR